jgi:hypothetical protein
MFGIGGSLEITTYAHQCICYGPYKPNFRHNSLVSVIHRLVHNYITNYTQYLKIYKLTLPIVLYRCESLFLMLGKILGLKKDKVTGDWKKLRNEELHKSYSSP